MKNRSTAPESLLAEFGLPPVDFDLIDLASKCRIFLATAAQRKDLDACRRALAMVLWLDERSKLEERYLYVCQDILGPVMEDEDLRSTFASILNGRTFSQLKGYAEYLTSAHDVANMAASINSSKRSRWR